MAVLMLILLWLHGRTNPLYRASRAILSPPLSTRRRLKLKGRRHCAHVHMLHVELSLIHISEPTRPY